MWDNPGETAPEYLETITHYSTFIVLKFNSPQEQLPTFPPSLLLRSILRKTRWKQLKETRRTRGQEPTLCLYLPNSALDVKDIKLWSWKKHEEPEDKNPHFVCTCLILRLMSKTSSFEAERNTKNPRTRTHTSFVLA